MLHRVRAFLGLGRRRQVLLLEAAALVTFAHLVTRILPFRRVRFLYGRPRMVADCGHEALTSDRRQPDPVVRDVRWALDLVHRRLYRERGCLARAIAGRLMLRRRGHAPTLFIGALRDTEEDVKLHAWLRDQGVAVTGVREARGFTTLAVFDGH